jgi:glycosyltransferase involved in cell wall biosynthesis
MPKVSVIIPAYNSQKTINATIQSVLCQTYKDLEVIVVSDGSTDKTVELVQGVADPRLQLFCFPNSGAAVSRNRGIKASTGNYVAFLNHDDLWHPKKIESQVKVLDTNSEIAAVYSWVELIDGEGKIVGKRHVSRNRGDVLEQLYRHNFILSGSNLMIRRTIFNTLGDFACDPNLRRLEDWEMWLRIARLYPFDYVPEFHVLYRIPQQPLNEDLGLIQRNSLNLIATYGQLEPIKLGVYLREATSFIYWFLCARTLANKPSRKNALQACKLLNLSVQSHPESIRNKFFPYLKAYIRIVCDLFSPDLVITARKLRQSR